MAGTNNHYIDLNGRNLEEKLREENFGYLRGPANQAKKGNNQFIDERVASNPELEIRNNFFLLEASG